MHTSVEFFDTQFSKQVQQKQHELNAFELLTLPYMAGDVLDFGCGLGNLSVAAAEAGCHVLAIDASPTAIAHVRKLASERALPITAIEADLSCYRIEASFDTVVSIGLLMFFDQVSAVAQLNHVLASVRPGGIASINVLIEGTTYLEMFDPSCYYLFGLSELRTTFSEWEILAEFFHDFEAPGGTVKRFATVIARRRADLS